MLLSTEKNKTYLAVALALKPRVIFIGIISRSLFVDVVKKRRRGEKECERLERRNKKSLTSDLLSIPREEKKLCSDCRYSSFQHSLMSPS